LTDNPRPGADRVGLTLAILERTREQIRAMLNDEQKKKYPASVTRELIAPADADTWLKLMQPAAGPGARYANQ
jgi:hypothetical protein